jgi:hypothetical protein
MTMWRVNGHRSGPRSSSDPGRCVRRGSCTRASRTDCRIRREHRNVLFACAGPGLVDDRDAAHYRGHGLRPLRHAWRGRVVRDRRRRLGSRESHVPGARLLEPIPSRLSPRSPLGTRTGCAGAREAQGDGQDTGHQAEELHDLLDLHRQGSGHLLLAGPSQRVELPSRTPGSLSERLCALRREGQRQVHDDDRRRAGHTRRDVHHQLHQVQDLPSRTHNRLERWGTHRRCRRHRRQGQHALLHMDLHDSRSSAAPDAWLRSRHGGLRLLPPRLSGCAPDGQLPRLSQQDRSAEARWQRDESLHAGRSFGAPRRMRGQSSVPPQ